jgi:hypothetical protein
MHPRLSKPDFWSLGDGPQNPPEHALGVYIMGYGENSPLYRVGAFGINSRAIQPENSIRRKAPRSIRSRMKECQRDWQHCGNLELCFFFITKHDWSPYLSQTEVYLQGEMYKEFLFVGCSHFKSYERQKVLDRAYCSMKALAIHSTLLNRIVDKGNKRGQDFGQIGVKGGRAKSL